MDKEEVTLRKPVVCHHCGHKEFFKSDTRVQSFQDIVNGKVVWQQIRRQRYRCKQCQLKVWDTVENMDTYRRKTVRLLAYLNGEKQ